MLCLDTDILLSLLKGDSQAISAIKKFEEKGEKIGTTIINLYEIIKGAITSIKSTENLLDTEECFLILYL